MTSVGEEHRFRYQSAKEEELEHEIIYPEEEERVLTYRHLLSTTYEPTNPFRVIAHCDVDAAYAQFEAARVGIDCSKRPIAVLQWHSLIAVNYPAREYGVNRFNCTLEEAKKRCPDLVLIHVATYGPGDTTPKYHANPTAKTHKISLDLYRRESKKIMDIFQRKLTLESATGEYAGYNLQPRVADGWMPKVLEMLGRRDDDIVCEKASIDESFFDLSLYVRKQILMRFPYLDIRDELQSMNSAAKAERLDTPLPEVPLQVQEEMTKESWEALGLWLPSDGNEKRVRQCTWVDLAHAIAAERMISVRKHIVDTLGYTTSAGIARNKALAKLCSSFRKPCSQTLLLPHMIPKFLAPLPYRKIRFLGGKFGAEIEGMWNYSTIGQLWQVSLSEMQAKWGEEGTWLYQLVRGIDTSEVNQRTANHSMMSAKNFRPGISTSKEALPWLSVMASELSVRLQEEREVEPMLAPRALVLRYLLAGSSGMKSHQTSFGYIANDQLATEIHKRAIKLWDDTLGRALRQPGHEILEIRVLSLSFAGIERGARDQQPLHVYFKQDRPKKRARDTDLNETTQIRKQPKAEEPDICIVNDPTSQTDMAKWSCPKCDHILQVPIFEDEKVSGSDTSTYRQILERLREEHVHWHMALDFAAT